MLFMIVGSKEPLYSLELSAQAADESQSHLNQFIVHSALDLVDRMAYTTNATNLRTVDRVYEQTVSCFLTPGNIKFMLLHEGRTEDSVRSFFLETHELYVKFLLNPFYEYNTPLVSSAFDKRVRLLARRL
mmetsp:Transcript_36558/g.97713  ORF Transcript_36558/g.97713 Transcript_36558/m.97713 type:complete len:130 (-) Transcript_36558:700-1089(-)